jgi:peptidyl-prolyl cis-trans isomerase SurA
MNRKGFLVRSILLLQAVLISACLCGQPEGSQMVDKVAAVIGNKIILQSEVQERYQEYVAEKIANEKTTCKVVEDLLYEKLLLIEAEKDSTITVSDAQVDQEFQKRVTYYINQFGSKEAFEKYYGKTVEQYKEELKPDVKDILLAQQMRSKITENTTVSPEDVRKYFNAIPADSVPFIDAQEEVAQVVKLPVISEEEKKIAKDKIDELKERVVKGESMGLLASEYTQDPGSIKNGGEYKNVKRGEFMPEFEKVAFSLKDSELSPVFETDYGYHFIQMLHRHGDLVDLRHILIIPQVSPDDLVKAKEQLDSIYELVIKDSLSFSEAAARYSDDKTTRYNGGIITNPQTGQSKWDMNTLGQLELASTISMNPGEISAPELYTSMDAKQQQGYRIIKVISRSTPHKANLKDDYQLIQGATLSRKQLKKVNEWINRKLKEGVFVHIDKEYTHCQFMNNWLAP